MANDNLSKGRADATCMSASVAGIIGTIVSLIYFIVATNSNGFSTTQLIQIILLLLCNAGIMLVGFISDNSKNTLLIPYGFGAVAFVMFAYEYMNVYVQKAVSTMTKYSNMLNVAFAIMYLIGAVIFIVAYNVLIGKIKNDYIAFILLSVMLGVFIYSFIQTAPQFVYRYLKADELKSLGVTFQVALIKAINCLPYFSIYTGLLLLQHSVSKNKELEKKGNN